MYKKQKFVKRDEFIKEFMIKSTTMPIILLNPVPTNSGLHDLGSS
jgi:hypothetical protein